VQAVAQELEILRDLSFADAVALSECCPVVLPRVLAQLQHDVDEPGNPILVIVAFENVSPWHTGPSFRSMLRV